MAGDSVAEWLQVGLNAGALVTGGVVWKMYFENLKATVGSKEAEVDLARERTDYWREKATELEKRTPEAVERVLAERIEIREAEIEKLAKDRDHGSEELKRVTEEVAALNRTMEQTKGFREVLAREQPPPEDDDYHDWLAYLESREDRVVEVEVLFLGVVGVDSGQLMLTDPCYIDGQWLDEPFELDRAYRDKETGATLRQGHDFTTFAEPLESYDGKTVKDLVGVGRLVELPPLPKPETFRYSYNGACQATLSDGHGELVYSDTGQAGAGVVFTSGWGDGFYPVWGEKHDGRIVRVYVNMGAEPAPLS